MAALRQIAPASLYCAAAVYPGEVRQFAHFCDRVVNAVRNWYESGGQKTGAALCSCEEILEHLVVGTSCFLAHVDVAHRSHDDAVLDNQMIYTNGTEYRIIRIQILCHGDH
ncbi:hypothetical protein SDC9_83890 [bioreactor metagenome]|uniref:Uncharacterized protein n=1 Tax=bioreactor metagenome TaxID=1076179 RepID=A0A644ZBM2_9ZZZZ